MRLLKDLATCERVGRTNVLVRFLLAALRFNHNYGSASTSNPLSSS